MNPLGTDPLHGPDPSLPDDQFEHDGVWYLVMVQPIRLPHFPLLYFFAGGDPILGTFYEDLGGWVARRVDRRFKLLVYRRHPPFFRVRGWEIVHCEVVVDEVTAEGRRDALLTDWGSQSFADAVTLRPKEVRTLLKAA